MPMTKCPDCGRDISTIAEACPQCGYSPERAARALARGAEEKARRSSGKLKRVGYLLGAAAIIVGFVLCAIPWAPKRDYLSFAGWFVAGSGALITIITAILP